MDLAPRRRWKMKLIIVTVVLLVGAGAWAYFSRSTPSPTPEAQQPDTSTTPQPDKEAQQRACIENIPTKIKFGQKLMVAVYNDLLEAESTPLAKVSIGGVIIMDATSKARITQLKDSLSSSPLVAVDQEGGTVQRYTDEGILPGADSMAADFTPAQAYERYYTDAAYLRSLGFTTNFAPVIDVISATPNPLPGRMYSTSPETVSTYAAQAIKGMNAAQITPVVKHFPGLGSATGNTDFVSASTDPLATLENRDLLPYQKLAHFTPDAMVSNAIVPGLTDGQPAVWSKAAVDLLRSYGYENAIIYTDSLTAQAIPGTLDVASIKAWQAGIDIALIAQTKADTAVIMQYLPEIIRAAEQALDNGDLDEAAVNASVARIFARKGIDACQSL